MPIRDIDAMNRSLDNDYGATKGPHAPTSHDFVLFSSDPMFEDDPTTVEIDATTNPGYARVTITNDGTWADAADGQKSTVAAVTLPAPTDEWADAATHWGLYGSDGLWWDCGPLDDDLIITGAGAGPVVTFSIFYADAVVGVDTEE